MKKYCTWCYRFFAFFTFLLVECNAFGQFSGEVFLNVDWLQKRLASPKAFSDPRQNGRFAELETVVFVDPYSVAELVLSSCKESEDVLPTERYFYFQFLLGVRNVCGNLRFTDCERGVVHIGYFDSFDQKAVHTGKIENMVSGVVSSNLNTVSVTFRGKKTQFQLPEIGTRNAEAARKICLDDERYISTVLDESGWRFHLLYSNPIKSFYFVLDEEAATPETFFDFERSRLKFRLGFDSRFLFLHDTISGRWILVGILADYVMRNSFFDGPFDQVPPNLDIKNYLEASYPYCKDRGGIDLNGNFVALAGQRVAISPYLQYNTLEEAVTFVREKYLSESVGHPSLRWQFVVREWKMDFVPPENNIEPHKVATSKSRPANHRRNLSESWVEAPKKD